MACWCAGFARPGISSEMWKLASPRLRRSSGWLGEKWWVFLLGKMGYLWDIFL
jgi:hypothetical protein